MNYLQSYLARLEQEYKTGVTTEHSLRQILVEFLKSLDELKKFSIINEPKRIACGAPDIVLLQKDGVPVAYIETKDIGDTDLWGTKQNKEQFARYKQGLDCVVFTDFLNFLLYQEGECIAEVEVARLEGDKLEVLPTAAVRFAELLAHLRDAQPVPIASAKKLAILMAGKAQLLARSITTVLNDKTSEEGRELHAQLERMREVLMSTVAPAEFADWYAQTMIYGLFAARYHDQTSEKFTRKEAAELIPQSNPFLRKLFQRIGVYDLDVRIAWIIDDLVGVFAVTNVRTLLDSSKVTERDPVMLFYEDFLAAYDPARRKAKGVYYTPAPVVEFIVRAVDEILQRDFDLKDGLADRSTTKGANGKTVHRLQILDPATGTGTFLVQTVHKIYEKFEGQEGVWNEYVRDHLLPRLHGYEILMAPYAMAHLNLEHVFRETGATELGNARYGIYLTNTLEDQTFDGNLFSPIDWEAQAASALKREKQVMVMLGNPPYNVSSANKSVWIEDLMLDYKRGLNEKNIKPLSDDYIKFIRYAQFQIKNTGEGIIAFVTNNSFLDGVIHRQMRKELLEAFDEIYILNLHGNSRLKERTPEGGKDENVFDIQVGVSINIFVKKKVSANKQAKLFYHELYGLRREKFTALATTSLSGNGWQELHPTAPYYFFVQKEFNHKKEYDKGIGLDELFMDKVAGFVTSNDNIVVQFTEQDSAQLIRNITELTSEELKSRCGIESTHGDWNLAKAREDITSASTKGCIVPVMYRLYDKRFVYYTGRTGGISVRPRYKKMGSLLHEKNYALCTTRIITSFQYQHCFVSNELVDLSLLSNRTSEGTYAFLLYKFPDNWDYTPTEIVADTTKDGKPIELELNMRQESLDKISKAVGETVKGEDVFDYIYGVLNDKEYREKYIDFLKIDFPHIPYPKDRSEYQRFVERGRWLRRLHLMDDTLDIPITATFSTPGTNLVEFVKYEEGQVRINETQYFGNIPLSVWEHKVGAYQPARLWLQKRVGRVLSYDDVLWYRRLVSTIGVELS
ncbi:MAG: type ISP restriction/modification enzyme [Bacteroides sp.]